MSEALVQSDVDGYGFQRSRDFDHKRYDRFMEEYLPVMTRRALRWNQLVGKRSTVSKSRTVKRFCRKGIPAALRPMELAEVMSAMQEEVEVFFIYGAWMCLSGADKRMKSNPYLYRQMLEDTHNQELVDTIKMDLHRTFPDNVYFATDNDRGLRHHLFNVLVAVGHRNRSLGYCQGMNFVAGLLLLVMKGEADFEEKVFWLMDTLINSHLPEYYHPDMQAVKLDQEVLGELVRWKAPDIYAHMDSHGVHWCLIGMKWYICLFADVLPVDTVLRIWDCLFYEGQKILMRAALVIILSNRENILKCSNFSEITDLFKETVAAKESLHCHTFIERMFKDIGSLPMARIQTLRQQCQIKVS